MATKKTKQPIEKDSVKEKKIAKKEVAADITSKSKKVVKTNVSTGSTSTQKKETSQKVKPTAAKATTKKAVVTVSMDKVKTTAKKDANAESVKKETNTTSKQTETTKTTIRKVDKKSATTESSKKIEIKPSPKDVTQTVRLETSPVKTSAPKETVAKKVKDTVKVEVQAVPVKPNGLPVPRIELERQRLAEYQEESRGSDDYMNEEQKAHFKKILEDWRDDIISDGQKLSQSLREEREPVADLNDRATLEEEFSLELRTRDRERRALSKIEKALKRIENDDFGYCEKCGDEIGLSRLEARPTAELCIDCKEIAERIEKNYIH